ASKACAKIVARSLLLRLPGPFPPSALVRASNRAEVARMTAATVSSAKDSFRIETIGLLLLHSNSTSSDVNILTEQQRTAEWEHSVSKNCKNRTKQGLIRMLTLYFCGAAIA